ncbi:MAG: DUF2177 family protein [Patescibacteria group bacterium]
MRYLKLFLTALPLLIILDVLWIGIFADAFYQAAIGLLLTDQVFWPAAFLFYVLYVGALIVFVLDPALKARSFKKALTLGALLGFTAYMTYDLTNLATIEGWPLFLSVVDIAWGTVASLIVSAVTYTIAQKYLKL